MDTLVSRLIAKGALNEADLPRIEEARASNPDKPLHQLLIERNWVREDAVLPMLAEEFGLELVDLSSHGPIDPEALAVMPSKLVHRRNLMPLSRENGTLIVATGDPF